MSEASPDILLLLDRLGDPVALDDAIRLTRRRLRILVALRQALEPAPADANGAPFRSPRKPRADGPYDSRPPEDRPGRGELGIQRRLKAAAYIAANGPQKGTVLFAEHVGVTAPHLCGLLNGCDWFEKEADGWHLTAEGRREALPDPDNSYATEGRD